MVPPAGRSQLPAELLLVLMGFLQRGGEQPGPLRVRVSERL